MSDTLWVFAGVAFLMALSPGPNLLYLASRSLCQGRGAGLASLGGVCTAMALYLLASAAGLAALFECVPLAYDLLRGAGATYLLYLAWKVLRHPGTVGTPAALPPESKVRLFRQGFLTCLLNPKVVITYGALLPQFVDPSAGPVLGQTLALGLVQIAAAASAHSLVIVFAAALSGRVKSLGRWGTFQRRMLATVWLTMAARLLWERRA